MWITLSSINLPNIIYCLSFTLSRILEFWERKKKHFPFFITMDNIKYYYINFYTPFSWNEISQPFLVGQIFISPDNLPFLVPFLVSAFLPEIKWLQLSLLHKKTLQGRQSPTVITNVEGEASHYKLNVV